MDIGVPKEVKNGEGRVALVPEDVGKIIDAGHHVFVERNAGLASGFNDEQYCDAGASIKDSVYDCPMIVRVKKPPLDTLNDNHIVMAYLHVEKGQDPALLKKMLEMAVTGYAYEEMRDFEGSRNVNLGFEAGLVGMYEAIRIWGGLLDVNDKDSVFQKLPPIQNVALEEAYLCLDGLNSKANISIVLMGNGCVSSGVQKVLRRANIKPVVLDRNETLSIEDYLPTTDMLVNATLWSPEDPQIVKQSMLKMMKRTALICDISCDMNGAIQTCIPTTWVDPTYLVDGITHFCVDNLPSAIPRESSIRLSKMILPHVLKVADGKILETGLMTYRGDFKYGKTAPGGGDVSYPRVIPS